MRSLFLRGLTFPEIARNRIGSSIWPAYSRLFLVSDGVEIPSDMSGVLYKPLDSAKAWRMELAKEIKTAGIEVDLNALIE